MKSQVLQCLKLSLLADTNTLKTATQTLAQMSKQPSYCMVLMEITDEQTLEVGLRQAALVQLKLTIRKYWNSQQSPISNDQKSAIIGALLPAFIRSSNSYPLLKMYKQIVTIIIGYVFQSWLPLQILCAKLNSNQNSVQVLQFIIAIETNFQMTIQQGQRNFYYQFIKAILPTIFNFVQNNSNEEVIYLAMKILWKIVHFQISHQVRTMLCNWMNLILNVVGASNQQMQANFQETQTKGSLQFFYFHAKKWATRVLHRFIVRHANPTGGFLVKQQTKKLNQEFSKSWYETFGKKVVEVVVNQFLVPSIKKTRYFQLKCLAELINLHPQQMKQYYESFQYKILPAYIQLQPEDEQIANNDPLEFINREGDLSFSYTYLKRQAKEAWIAFANVGAKKKKKSRPQQVGPLFNESMKWIQSKLEGNNLLQKQMAMYLICQLRSSITNCDQIKKILPTLIAQYVITEFTSQTMFLRARSMEIFSEYGDLITDKLVIKKAVQGIYFCLTQDNYPLVRLRAAQAFNVLLQHEEARQEVKPLFQQILKIYLILMEKYDSQTLVFSLSGIVEHFGQQVGPYACQLMKYLSKHFIKLFTKDKVQSEDPDYDGQTELAASGVLGTMKTLLQSSIDKQSVLKMQPDLLDVCDYVFSCDDVDYIEDLISVLRAYTSNIPHISESLLFQYVLMIYYVVGIDKHLWDKIPLMPIPEIKKKCLNSVRSGCNIQSIDSVMLVLRNFISIDSSLLLKYTDPFGINLLELLFSMVNHIYQKGPDQYEGEVQMNSCTILMVYLLENNHKKWDDNMLTHIWQVAKHNLQKGKSKVLTCLNAELIGMLLWNNCVKTLMLAQSDNLLRNLLICLLNSSIKLKQEHQRQRVILGISQLIGLNNMPQQVIQYLPKLFNFVIELVKKNCDYRLNEEHDQNYETQSQDDEQEQLQLNLDDDQVEDIWQEDYNRNYVSKLEQVDEVRYFRENIQKLQKEQSVLYNQLISLIPIHELNQLDQKVSKAIQFASDNLKSNKSS